MNFNQTEILIITKEINELYQLECLVVYFWVSDSERIIRRRASFKGLVQHFKKTHVR
jgi:hypothetical protein